MELGQLFHFQLNYNSKEIKQFSITTCTIYTTAKATAFSENSLNTKLFDDISNSKGPFIIYFS